MADMPFDPAQAQADMAFQLARLADDDIAGLPDGTHVVLVHPAGEASDEGHFVRTLGDGTDVVLTFTNEAGREAAALALAGSAVRAALG